MRAHPHEPAPDDDPRWDWDGFRFYSAHGSQNRKGYPVFWEEAPLWAPARESITDQPAGLYTSPTQADNLQPVTGLGIKDLIRELTGHRCIRCGHPYRVGQHQFWNEPAEAESDTELVALTLLDEEPTDEPRVTPERPVHWSSCDELCTHGGLVRWHGNNGRDYWQREDLPAAGAPAWIRAALETGNQPQAAWRILTVHHLDENKGNCSWWNLTALCQRCHLNVQRRVKMERPWPYAHSDWLKPYVAAYYAHKYLGEELRRIEAIERMPELLALEHTQEELSL